MKIDKKGKNTYILPDPRADKIQYWVVNNNLFSHLHPVVDLFYRLTKQTCPHPNEHIIYKPIMDSYRCQQDQAGNYYLWVLNPDGTKPKTMFTSHLDTADRNIAIVKHRCFSRIKFGSEEEDYFFETDGTSILGADCKAGTALQLWMIENKFPGLYYFFLGEEVGLIGAHAIAKEWKGIAEFSEIKHCVSFDRRGHNSIISNQSGTNCCSPEFVTALSKEFAEAGLKFVDDPGGIATDSLAFIETIPECTNLSVGYYGAHTKSEIQDVSFLGKLADALLKIKWEELPAVRVPVPRHNYTTYLKTKDLTTSKTNFVDDWDDWDDYTYFGKNSQTTPSNYARFVEKIKSRICYVIEFREIKTAIKENPIEFVELLLKSLDITEEKLLDKIIAHLYPKI